VIKIFGSAVPALAYSSSICVEGAAIIIKLAKLSQVVTLLETVPHTEAHPTHYDES
jgi:hypothetical protein